jgi:oligopeptide/dipeptide ABC transporter ATP-binding protein
MADRVAVMYAGRIVEEGPVDAMFEDPRHPYTIGLKSSIPRLDVGRGGSLVPIPGMPPSMSNLPPGCPFHPRCGFAIARCKEAYPEEREIPGPAGRHLVRCHVDDVTPALAARAEAS